MAEPISAAALSVLLDDTQLRESPSDFPDSHLLARVASGEPLIAHLADVATSAASQALHIAISSGQALDVLFRRHEGEFAIFLATALPKKPDGSDFITEETARKYRGLWRGREILLPADGSEPPCRNLTDAYIKLHILPEPEQAERDPHALPPAFRLSFTLPTGEPVTWAPATRREFLTRAEPVAKAYEAAMAAM